MPIDKHAQSLGELQATLYRQREYHQKEIVSINEQIEAVDKVIRLLGANGQTTVEGRAAARASRTGAGGGVDALGRGGPNMELACEHRECAGKRFINPFGLKVHYRRMHHCDPPAFRATLLAPDPATTLSPSDGVPVAPMPISTRVGVCSSDLKGMDMYNAILTYMQKSGGNLYVSRAIPIFLAAEMVPVTEDSDRDRAECDKAIRETALAFPFSFRRHTDDMFSLLLPVED